MNSSFDTYKSVGSQINKRDELAQPVSAKYFAHHHSTFRGRESSTNFTSPSRKVNTPLSVPATGSFRRIHNSLREVPGSGCLVCFRFVGKLATELKDIKLFKNLVFKHI